MLWRLRFSPRAQNSRGTFPVGLLLALSLALPARSQSLVTPPRGDPEVLHIYLRQVHREVEKLKQPDAAMAATPLDARAQSAAGRLGVRPEGLPLIDAVYRNLATAMLPIDSASRAYVAETALQRRQPEMARLSEFEARRTRLINETREQLRWKLGEAAWQRLEAFVDGRFRLGIKRRILQ